MKLRHFVALILALAVLIAHARLQTHAWQVHTGRAQAAGLLVSVLGAHLWPVVSFPTFTVFSRRMQNLHFDLLMFCNSAFWALVAGVALGALFSLFRVKPRRPPKATRTLGELKAPR